MKRIFFSFFGMLVITICVIHFAFYPVARWAVSHYLENQINTYLIELVEGEYYLLNADLKLHPESQWPARIDAVGKHFGFPVHIGKGADPDLEEEKHSLFKEGEIVVKMQNSEISFYQKVGKTDWVITLGPIDENMGLGWVNPIIFAADIIIIGMLTIIWALIFRRKLQKIIRAALSFGDGRLETRCKVSRLSALSPLAEAFNRMANQIQHLIDAQKELTHAVSHELRTPIARIRFSFELLKDAAKISDRNYYMAEIFKDIEELEELVTESLTYARFNQRTLEIKWQPCILEPWVQDIVENETKNKLGINVYCKNRLSPPDHGVYLDARLMRRAVGNLIQNAVLHAKNRVEVIITKDGDDCVLHVDDDGSGIPPADRHRVFRAFIRLDTSRNRSSGGYGLGLAIVRRVSSWHGGQAVVTEAPLGGARFTIRWPGFSEKQPVTLEQ